MPTTSTMQPIASKKFWSKKNIIVPTITTTSNNRKPKRTFSLPPSPITEIIKLSTVNGSGIYMPPSPSDEYNSNEDYFSPTTDDEDSFQLPCCDRLTPTSENDTTQRQFYTPSSHL